MRHAPYPGYPRRVRKLKGVIIMADDVKTPQEVLRCVYDALNEKGYNPISQLTGFLVSNDPSYITTHNNARNLMRKYENDEYVEQLLRMFFDK
jgi:uncharacterized protein (UPF0297 family)